MQEELTERTQTAQAGNDARETDGQSLLPKPPLGRGAEAHCVGNVRNLSSDSRQQKRARVRAGIKKEIAIRFYGNRKVTRAMLKVIERDYWKQNRGERLMAQAEKDLSKG